MILSHLDPDGDSLGSQLAVYNYVTALGKKADVIIDGLIPYKYRFFPGLENIVNIDSYSNGPNHDLAIFLECPEPQRAGRVGKLLQDDIKIINIDHHPDNAGYGDIVYADSAAAAVAEMLTYFFTDLGFKIDKDTATVLYAGILTDTGRFRFNSTTRRTMDAAGQLIEHGADPRVICDKIYYSLPPSVLKLTAAALSRIELFDDGRICIIALDKNAVNGGSINPSDTEGMAEYTLYAEKAVVGGFLKETKDNHTKISLRSRDSIDVSRLAHKHGGGGHYNASGFSVEMPLPEARRMLLEELKELIHAAV